MYDIPFLSALLKFKARLSEENWKTLGMNTVSQEVIPPS